LILGGRARNQLKMDKTIVFCWIPSHVNIRSNERADDAAKSALTSPITDMKFPASELIPYVHQFCLDEWEDIWDCCRGNKFHAIYPTVGTALQSRVNTHPGI